MANVTIIPDDYDSLKKEYLILRKELDCVNQELYACKRNLRIVEALQHEYQSEIEILQSEENRENQSLKEKIVQLEEAVNNVRLQHREQIQAIETELSKKEEENESLLAEIELLKKTNVSQSCEENSKILDELVVQKQKNELLLETEEELKLSLEMLQKNNVALEETLTEYKEELLILKESVSCKRSEISEANDLIQKLNDDIFCLKHELESYKNKPLNQGSKGNSLFAEVDDRRVYLQKTINTMKVDYISMKQERAKHLNTISHLRKENKMLCDRWKADMEEKEEDEYTVLKAYKNQIQILEDLVQKYKSDLSAKPVVIGTGTFSEIEFYQVMINNKVKELEELRNQLAARSLTQTVLSTSLKEANKEIRKWRLEATLLQCQLDLKAGELLPDNTVREKFEEVMEDQSVELRPKMGPNLACRKQDNDIEKRNVVKAVISVTEDDKRANKENTVKEIITVDDSFDDIQIIDPKNNIKEEVKELHEEQITSDGEIVKKSVENEQKTLYIKEEHVSNDESNSIAEDDLAEEKENICENSGDSHKVLRKVTFAQNTLSPRATGRSGVRRNCKRIEVPKPIYIPSE